MKAKNSLLAVSAGILLLGSAIQVSAQTIWGTRNRPLEGRRYETMRALAHYLDETTQSALQTAREDARRGAQGRRILPLVRDFARRADEFHTTMDNYEARRVDIPPRVNDLIGRARNINGRLETTFVTNDTRAEWNDVVDVLDRMKRLMAGEDVQVPMAHGGFEDYDRDYGMFGGVRRTSDTEGSAFGWTGTRLADFRRLARELDESALRSYQLAETSRVRYGPRDAEFLSDLRRFAERAHDVRVRADAREVNRREIDPIVNRLLQDARETQRSLRDTRVFPQVWDQWARTIDVLSRMTDLARDGGVRPTSDTGGSVFGWTGTRLEDFRRLAHDLDQSALRAHQIAETNRVSSSIRHEEFLLDLRRFAERAHDVHVRADAGDVNPREMRPIVNQLLQDARETDRSLRDTRVFPQVWEQWARTIDVMARMADLVRD